MNPLEWFEDEERGPLVGILEGLTGGINWWNATCERTPDGTDWEICFSYLGGPDGDDPMDWCTLASAPIPPPNIPPQPPPAGWPEAWGNCYLYVIPSGGGAICNDPLPYTGNDFDPDLGPWGGWEGLFTSALGADLYIAIYPISYTGTTMTWQLLWEKAGLGAGDYTADTAFGDVPSFNFGVGEWPPCPTAATTVSLNQI